MSVSRHRKETDDEAREDGDSDNILHDSRAEAGDDGQSSAKLPLMASGGEVGKKHLPLKPEVSSAPALAVAVL